MKRRARTLGVLCAIAAASTGFIAASPALAAAADTGLTLPAPGSYRLDHIQRVPFAIVLEGNNVPHVLSRYTTGAITLLSFFYSTCADPNGCPLAWDAFEHVRKAILAQPDHYGRVRLVFLSLDPAHDTPSMLKNFAKAYDSGAAVVPWHFLTSYSYLFLNPVLRSMGEEISVDRNASGSGERILNHLLKVFLIDPQGWVREIYSNQSLDPAAILGDIKTLTLEAADHDDPLR
ncbi:SCO family protein [Methylocapsa sp. D3K7]|uniref:SCO family protein n=1 Tax=Methylocapsa sp. D3K7 TaxID=3041435 RepID=UPI00244EE09C|nr:SCO family protein [Methylocapsa sp. D3K7]WGJ16524.1 SCO family protein [Methylocapsa sp. D3K7]